MYRFLSGRSHYNTRSVSSHAHISQLADPSPIHMLLLFAIINPLQLTPIEVEMLSGVNEDKLLTRLITMLTIKEALISGLGQPVGFDLSRIEVNVPENWIRVDKQQLLGWEFRLFRCQQECNVNDVQYMEQYQVAIAFYRGNNISKFVLVENPRDIERLTQYFSFDNLVKVIPKLLQDS